MARADIQMAKGWSVLQRCKQPQFAVQRAGLRIGSAKCALGVMHENKLLAD
jgi:hypothetical protein